MYGLQWPLLYAKPLSSYEPAKSADRNPQYKKQKNILNNNASILQSIHRAAVARRDAAKRVFSQNFLNIQQFKTVCQQHCETV